MPINFEIGLQVMSNAIKGTDDFNDFAIYESALLANLQSERKYGSTETLRHERSRLVEQLNELALSKLGISFNELCQFSLTARELKTNGRDFLGTENLEVWYQAKIQEEKVELLQHLNDKLLNTLKPGVHFYTPTVKVGDSNTMGDTYNVGQSAATGKYARSDNNTFIQSEQKQTLAEAAAEIQRLLKQLEQTNPNATEIDKVNYVNEETTHSFKRRVVGALQAGGEAVIEEFLDNPYVNVGKAVVKGWIKPE